MAGKHSIPSGNPLQPPPTEQMGNSLLTHEERMVFDPKYELFLRELKQERLADHDDEQSDPPIESSAVGQFVTTETVQSSQFTPEQEAEAIFSRENMPKKIDTATALQLFSYADVLPNTGNGEANTPNAHKYAAELVGMYDELGGEGLMQLIDTLKNSCREIVATVGINESVYTMSDTWALWDLAKQRYASRNDKLPIDGSERYLNRYLISGMVVRNDIDPLEDTVKLWDIVDRQVGWEIQREFLEDKPGRSSAADPVVRLQEPTRFSARLRAHSQFAYIADKLLNGARNEHNAAGPTSSVHVPALRSYELSEIGERTRQAAVELNNNALPLTKALYHVNGWSKPVTW